MRQALPSQIQAAIVAAGKQYITVFNQNDAAGVADHFTENAGLLPAYGNSVTSKEATQAFWQAAFDMGIKSAKCSTIEVERQGRYRL
jgi:ketosteroid isomerase-like protein